MTRKEIKRRLALLRAEAELDRPFPFDLPEGFKESFENQPAFRGWINYHVTWDVSDEDAWQVVPLKASKEAEWNQQLAKRVPVITKAGEIVTPQQFDAMEKAGVKKLEELDSAEE